VDDIKVEQNYILNKTMNFTDEQFEMLHEHADWFITSVMYHSTIRSAPRNITEMVANIYESATGAKVNRNWSCAPCVMNIYRMVGTLYLDDKEKRQKQLEKEDAKETINVPRSEASSSGENESSKEDREDRESKAARHPDTGSKENGKKGNVGSKGKGRATKKV
jgi:hypothetical protein